MTTAENPAYQPTHPAVKAIVDHYVSEGFDPDGEDYFTIAQVTLDALSKAGYTLMHEPVERAPRCNAIVRWAGVTNVCGLAVGHDGMHERLDPDTLLPVRWTPQNTASQPPEEGSA